MPEHLSMDSFLAQLHTKFRVSVEPGQIVELELVEVQPHGDVPGQGERFTATFRGPLDRFLPQQTYHTEHAESGGADIFIVPIRKDGEGIYYEAIFNRVT